MSENKTPQAPNPAAPAGQAPQAPSPDIMLNQMAQAVEILDQAASRAPLTRAEHIQVDRAANLLRRRFIVTHKHD